MTARKFRRVANARTRARTARTSTARAAKLAATDRAELASPHDGGAPRRCAVGRDRCASPRARGKAHARRVGPRPRGRVFALRDLPTISTSRATRLMRMTIGGPARRAGACCARAGGVPDAARQPRPQAGDRRRETDPASVARARATRAPAVALRADSALRTPGSESGPFTRRLSTFHGGGRRHAAARIRERGCGRGAQQPEDGDPPCEGSR